MSIRCGTICLTQIPTIPLSNKESPCKLIFTSERPSSHLKDIRSIEIEILFTALQHTPYVKQSSVINLESSTSSTRILLCLFAPWELNRFYLPLKQRIQASLQVSTSHFSSEKIMCSIEVTPLHCVGWQHVLHKVPGVLFFTAWSTLLHCIG